MDKLRNNQTCFVCGKENPVGLSVDFEINANDRTIRGSFIPLDMHQGFEGIVHGGILSALLDEAMGKLAFDLGLPAMTAELALTFKAPAAPGEELLISARIVRENRRMVQAEARIERGPVVVAEAKGKLLRIK